MIRKMKNICDLCANLQYVLMVDDGWAIGVRLVQGAACGIIYALLGPLCVKYAGRAYVALAVAMSIGVFRLGVAVPILTAAALCRSGDWSTNFYLIGGFSLLLCAIWLMVSFQRRIHDDVDVRQSFSNQKPFTVLVTALRIVLKEYSSYLLMISSFCIHIAQFTVFVFGPKFYQDVYDLKLSENRWFSVGPMLAAVVGAPIGGV